MTNDDVMHDERFGCLTEAEFEKEFERRYVDFQPWEQKGPDVLRRQGVIQSVLTKRAGAKIGRNVYIAEQANVLTSHFVIGDNSFVAAGAIIRGYVSIGNNTSVNPFAHIAGKVSIGSGVRIAGMVALYGFNHGFDDLTQPIYTQPSTVIGITVEDDVWIGTNAVVLDGSRIGAHSIVAAGAIVTKSFPEYSIVAGNPARLIRDRRDKT